MQQSYELADLLQISEYFLCVTNNSPLFTPLVEMLKVDVNTTGICIANVYEYGKDGNIPGKYYLFTTSVDTPDHADSYYFMITYTGDNTLMDYLGGIVAS